MFKQIRKKDFKIAISAFSLLLFLFIACTNHQIGKENAPIYRNGMVVTANPLASKVGLEILKKGGNAVDAAVAVQFALAVVYPNAGNIGGGGFMVYRSSTGESNTLDFREKAPEAASKNMYLDSAGNPIANLSTEGHLAVGVPGSVAGMWQAHQKYGKLDWKDLIQPAIKLAKSGFKITQIQAEELNSEDSIFRVLNSGYGYLVNEKQWKKDDLLIQNDLVETLKLIQEQGRDGFYKGKTADLIADEMMRNKGLITKRDLVNYQAVWRKPLIGNYKGYKIIAMPPPSSGGVALLQLLGTLENYPLAKYPFHGDSSTQIFVEAERRAYADRATYLGDPDFYQAPIKNLLSKSYLKNRMNNFSFDKATPSSEILAGDFKGKESEQTTHFSITDKDGNAVAITTTLNGSFGAKVFVKGAGFLLNNEMDDFSVKPGTPNMYGLVGGEANAIQPNKRMLSSMTPTIVEKDGKLFMVVGSPGGSTIITTVLQTITNVIDYQMSIQKAVNVKRVHHQWLPDLIYIEKDALDSLTSQKLTHKGYKILERGNIGRCDAILLNKWGYYEGGADPRGDDSKMGY
ncbi:MAG: gamma-glutamyltransferase [Bacteroidetes bacterium]|nr:gamma-glutamyltransferase [Bacteroidota bacterium]MBU1372916.1 gamma-glutamyltransferase [Bacteroidota bacterium]MBU1484180.1 gamma-glutamyltransferase [Bacteroidota bacterium]MBU2046377.1 gamma-glutamyltransferase [Bacteroidota bacterium]MBU2267401.1 gamma-glutamyltransferase [Bacteroidota bacterium]